MSADFPFGMMFSSPSQQERSGEPLCRPGCQIHSLPELAEPLGKLESAWQFFKKRLKRFTKRRLRYVQNTIHEVLRSSPEGPVNRKEEIQPGDVVFVLPREEIRKTLNRWNGLRGCVFMEEMWVFCGTKQRVLKRVNTFLDERDYKMKKCKGIVILDGVLCSGTTDFGTCDRSCFFFWREEWLKKSIVSRPCDPSMAL
jgi:hypothetical protein